MDFNHGPYCGRVPKIVLPTVFGDALTYLEQIGALNAELNKAIENINEVATNLEEAVKTSVENAKIPVYVNLVNNGSTIISPSNWNVDNAKALYDALSGGKLCILYANLVFNEDGLPVANSGRSMYFILTQMYQLSTPQSANSVYCTFMAYDEAHVRYAAIYLYNNNGVITSEVDDLREIPLPTEAEFEQVDNLFKKCVYVYKGDEPIPSVAGQYIELTNNATETDLSEYFVVQNDGTMYVPDCAPSICVDYHTGNIGQLLYGGDTTPWARVYSAGIQLRADLAEQLTAINTQIAVVDGKTVANSRRIGTVEDSLAALADDVTNLSGEVDNIPANTVQYTTQNPSASQKERARANIGAVGANDPVFSGELTLQSGYGSAITFTVTNNGGVVSLTFYPQRVQIDGVIDPTSAQQVATKNYVDNAVTNIDGVLYTPQVKNATEQAAARQNIGAVSNTNPEMHGILILHGEAVGKILNLYFDDNAPDRVLYFGGGYGPAVLRNIGTPVNDSDAANKQYVDNIVRESEGNVKYSTTQNLSDSDKARARQNIGAVSTENAEVYDSAEILQSEPTINPALVFSADEQRKIELTNNGELSVQNLDNELSPLFIGDSNNLSSAVSFGKMIEYLTPVSVLISAAENAWTASRNGTAIGDLGAIINQFSNGISVRVAYPTVGTFGTAYAAPLYAGQDVGIVCEVFNGYQRKRYTLNTDGSVTTVVLETVTP